MSHNRQWWFGAFASLPFALLAGCATPPAAAMTAEASQLLGVDVTRVDTASRAGNTAAVRAALAQLRADLAQLKTAGSISSERAAAVLAAADRVAADTGANKAAPSPSPSPSPKPVVVVTPSKGKAKHKDGGGGEH